MSDKKLSREEITHLAKLANLPLTEDEIEKYQEQLSSIVEYISKLDQVDTKNVESVSQVTGLVNVTVENKVDNVRTLSQEDALRNVPSKKDGFVKVKAIFG